ncbi:MAG: CusA/CzcA family heavy metal efflux RND transporter [Deltaproteobacteria bacterium]|nr:CusA/CzcA family heavy metal efflux RND transporter [Deltaproteobacteria bacterium]
MINKLVEGALKVRAMILLAVVGILAFGVWEYQRMPVEAFPDISPIMVPVFAEAHGMAPEEVERLIAYPIESAMNGLPHVTQIKSTSAFGMAVVYVYFEDDVDIYFARQLVGERLSAATSELPHMEEPPRLGPISTGLGQVFIYYLTLDKGVDTHGKDPGAYLREINDWVVKFQLRTVPGVTDILSMGGHVLQFQIQVDPRALQKYGIGLEDMVAAVRENNRNAGGQFLVLGSEEHLVRGIGLLKDLEEIRKIPIKVVEGVPVRVEDVARVGYGNGVRRGVVTHNGTEEVVSGIVLKLFGENSSKVIQDLYRKVEAVEKSLPPGVTLHPYYEQAELVKQATWTIKKALVQGALLVMAILLVFLGNLRSAFIVALSLPICAFISIIFMRLYGISANLMSLGGIAIGIGMLADGAIVMVENIHRHLNSKNVTHAGRMETVLKATREVSRPILFSIAIIIIVFLPIFSLQDVEGKMFTPMAFTICFALFGSILSALFVAPALSSLLLKKEDKAEFRLTRFLKRVYRPMLLYALRKKYSVMGVSLAIFLSSLGILPLIGTEFIPTLEEGSIMIGVTMAPSISLEKATETVMRMERTIMARKEVSETVSRIGRPEAGSHPHPVNYAEIHVELKPSKEWPDKTNKKGLVRALNRDLSVYKGVKLNFTQPIQNAFDELLSGIKAQLAIKVFGEDLAVLKEKAFEIKEAIENVPGLVDLNTEQALGQPQVQVVADRQNCARYGITVGQILEIVELAVGGEAIDNIYLNTRRFDIHLRYQASFRMTPAALGELLVHTEDGSLIPLSRVAAIRQVTGPMQISRENNQRRWIVYGNIRGRDLGNVFKEIQERIAQKVVLPPGYTVQYGGQFENQQRAVGRLMVIVPIVIFTVFIMLWMTFGTFKHAFLIILNVPLALTGGIIGLYMMGEYLSVPAAVGFIALFGIAVQNGVVLVSTIDQLMVTGRNPLEAILEGGMLRLRPVLMTAATTILGLLPLLLSRGIGSEVQRPLSIVVVFGLASSTLLTLFLLPAVMHWIEARGENKREEALGKSV